jgi:hypothetical protein
VIRRIAVVALVAVFLLLGSSGVQAQVEEDDREVRQRSKTFEFILGQGEDATLEIEVREGGSFNWVVTSGGRAVEFHMFSKEQGTSHLGPKRTTSDSGTFIAPADDEYVFTIEREERLEAVVRLTLNGEFGIVAVENMELARDGPGPAVVLLLGALVAGAAFLRGRSR